MFEIVAFIIFSVLTIGMFSITVLTNNATIITLDEYPKLMYVYDYTDVLLFLRKHFY